MKYFLFSILILLFVSCGQTHRETPVNDRKSVDTLIIGSRTVTDEIAGSAYQKRATSYFVIYKQDTSEFMPVFTESKENGAVDIIIRFQNTITYQKHINELKLILPKAETEFRFDSLKSISLGRLYLSGDLAIEITRQYLQTFGGYDEIRTTDYQRISSFLLHSKLSEDINTLLKPYRVSVESVSIEKVFYTTRENLLGSTKIEMDTALIPEKILDCQTWVILKKY